MQVRVQHDKNAAVISVSGDVDLYSSPEMRKAIASLSKKRVPLMVVNLEDVDYMDSSGIATLVEGLQLTCKYNGSFRIACLKPAVWEVFELARLDRVFEIYETEEEALKVSSL